MLRLTNWVISCRGLSALLTGCALLSLTGCGGAEGGEASVGSETVDHTEAALAPGWVTVTPKNGWSNFSTSTPAAVGNFNGVIVFRGALKATTPRSTTVFDMPAQFQPGSAIFMKISLSGGAGGMLEYDYLCHCVKVFEDGVSPAGVGSAAKTFTSLDGASFDLTEGTAYFASGQQEQGPWSWESTYGFRPLQNGNQGVFFTKQVDGFVRLQGFLSQRPAQQFDNYLFTLPSNLAPADTVQVYASLGSEEFADTSWGELAIYSNGAVYTQGDPYAWAAGTSLEGVSYSKTLAGNSALTLINGWSQYSSLRAVRVGKYGNVVRFQGAIRAGTNTKFATLPASMRPGRTVYIPTIVNGPASARILISTTGDMTIENPGGLSNAALFTSLDGVSFGL